MSGNKSAIHFCGRMFSFDEKIVNRLSERIADVLETHDVIAGFGSMACGSDILIAERLVERGALLRVFLPFDSEKFLETSVLIGGFEWEKRYYRCLESVDRVTVVNPQCDTPHAGEGRNSNPYNATTRYAMGEAISWAELQNLGAIQIAMYDGILSKDVAGTAADVREWKARNLPTETITISEELRLNGSVRLHIK